MIAQKHIIGKTPYVFGISQVEGTDIDNLIDFDYAEHYYLKQRLI